MTEDNSLAEFAKILYDPKAVEKLQLKAGLEEFKTTYKLERASPLKCPVCSQWGQTGGSLWISYPDEQNERTFTCRKCRITFKLEIVGQNLDEFIIHLREKLKEKN